MKPLNTKKLEASINHGLELATDMARGDNNDSRVMVTLNSQSNGYNMMLDYQGMLYRIEIVPTYMALLPPKKPTADSVFFDMDHCNESECDNCQFLLNEDGYFNHVSGDCEPPNVECQGNPDECPAIERLLDAELTQWVEDTENYYDNRGMHMSAELKREFDEIMGNPLDALNELRIRG